MTEYERPSGEHEPCLVVFKHKTRRWECPMGKYDGLPDHKTVVDAASAELYEETSCLVEASPQVLRAIGVRGDSPMLRGGRALHDGWFALRVDGLSRLQFEQNRRAIEQHADKKKLGCYREMTDIRFLPLSGLREPLAKCTATLEDLDNEKKCVTVRDVDGNETELGKLAKKLRGNKEDLGGLDMAECAFRNGPCRTILKTDPTVTTRRWPIRGATTLAAVAPAPITVATYNIAGGQDTFSHERVLAALRSLDADVICLQEVAGDDVGHTQAHRLARDLGMKCIFGNAHQERLFGNAILSHFPLTLIDEIELPRGSLNRDDGTRMPGQKERRAALAVTVSPFTDVPKYDFLCICTHVGIYNSAEEATKGQEPGRIIGEFVKSETWKDTPALLAGDLNRRWATPFVGVVARLDRNWNIHPSAGTKTRKSDDRKHKIDYICDRGRGTWRMQGGLTHAAGSWTHAVRNESTDPGDGSLPPSGHLPLKAVWVPLP